MRWPNNKLLRRINWLLVGLIIAINGYVLLTPFLPEIDYHIHRLRAGEVTISTKQPATLTTIDRSHNQLIIPSIWLTQAIHEGNDPHTVNKGIWRRPETSTPNNTGNTVLVGHRFSYTNPSVLYNLDKVSLGDEIFAVWDGKIYAYTVTETKVVNPEDTQIEAATTDARLTIYTCTPLWSTKHRLVVIANLEKIL